MIDLPGAAPSAPADADELYRLRGSLPSAAPLSPHVVLLHLEHGQRGFLAIDFLGERHRYTSYGARRTSRRMKMDLPITGLETTHCTEESSLRHSPTVLTAEKLSDSW